MSGNKIDTEVLIKEAFKTYREFYMAIKEENYRGAVLCEGALRQLTCLCSITQDKTSDLIWRMIYRQGFRVAKLEEVAYGRAISKR